MKDWQATMGQIKNRGCWGVKYQRASPIHKAELAMEVQLKRSSRAAGLSVSGLRSTQDSEAATMLPDAETTLTVVSNQRHCTTVPTVQSHTDTEAGNRVFRVYRGGVRIRCSEIHTSDLVKEIQLKRNSRAECEWTIQDWRAAMHQIKDRGCWGMKYRNGKDPAGVSVTLGGVRIGCSKIHKSELQKEIQLKRSSRAECEWTMKDWRAAMDQIKNRGCWGIKYHHNGH
jgi:hypothetical protein